MREHIREMDYMAHAAGIGSSVSFQSDYIKFDYVSYNDKMEEYFQKFFSQIQKIELYEERTFFNNMLENKIRAYKNSFKSEPYQKMGRYFQELMYGDPPIREYINIMENLTYEEFNEFKTRFFRNLRFEWLVCGHLTQERALNICDTALQSIDHKSLDKDELLTYH